MPREGLEHNSEIFKNMFTMPDTTNEGGSDDNPIHLPFTKKQAFNDLLVLLYPRLESLKNGQHESSTSQSGVMSPNSICHWFLPRVVDVFELVMRWDFEKIKDDFIRFLKPPELWDDVVEQIVFAHRHGIECWYLGAYKKLANRKKPLTSNERKRLGPDFSSKMQQVRKRRIRREARSMRPPSSGPTINDLRKTFKL